MKSMLIIEHESGVGFSNLRVLQWNIAMDDGESSFSKWQ